MPIRVKCKCQQQFDARDDLAGKTVKCPKCSSPITIPMATAAAAGAPAAPTAPRPAARPTPPPAPSMAGLLDEAGVKQRNMATGCPGCGSAFAPDAVICVECGYNFRTGRKLETRSIRNAPTDAIGDGHGVNAEFLIQKARDDMAAEKEMQKKMVSFGIPWWGYLLILIGIVCFIVGMASLPQDLAMKIAGWTMIVAAELVIFACWIWIRIIAFRDSTTQGIMVLLIPCYEIIYIFTHWDECSAPFFFYLLACVVSGLGGGALALSEIINQPEGEVMFQLIRTAIPV